MILLERLMNRRELLAAVLCGALLPSLASAQEPGRVYRVAVISPAEGAVGMIRDLQMPELARLGFVVGRNLTLTTPGAHAGASAPGDRYQARCRRRRLDRGYPGG